MKSIIELLKQNSHSADILQDLYGVSSNEHFDAVFVAPSWTADRVFDMSADNIELVYQDRFSTSHRITSEGKKYLFIKLEIGAPNIMDFCLSCHNLDCDNFVFVGAVGSLVPQIDIGDVFVPSAAISGNGATVYLHEKLDAANLFERTYANIELSNKIRSMCTKSGIIAGDALPISIDTIMCEYLHLDKFRNMGAQLIEMEVATFFKAISAIGKAASAILVVSDNSAVGQHLIGITEETKARYHAVRGKLKDILLKI